MQLGYIQLYVHIYVVSRLCLRCVPWCDPTAAKPTLCVPASPGLFVHIPPSPVGRHASVAALVPPNQDVQTN